MTHWLRMAMRTGSVPTLLVSALVVGAAAQPPPPRLRVVHKARGVTVRAVPETPWCAFGPIQIEPVRLELEPRTDGKVREVSAEDEARLARLMARLGADLSMAFRPLLLDTRTGRALSIVPKVRHLRRNKAWLNVLGLVALQAPLTGSGVSVELEITDRARHQVLAVMSLTTKGFWASQFDLTRYRYAFSPWGQAHASAKARGEEAARQLGRLLTCS